MNDQRSLKEQLGDLVEMANKAGLYDAADYLVGKAGSKEVDAVEHCSYGWKRQVFDWRRRASKALTEPEYYPAIEWIEDFVESATTALGPPPIFRRRKDD